MAGSDPVEIFIQPPDGARSPRAGEPIRLGIPLADGWAVAADQFSLHRAGRAQPLQARALDRWPSGAIRWLLVDFLADHDGTEAAATYELRSSGGGGEPGMPVTAREDAAGVRVETGAASFQAGRSGEFLTTATAAITLSIADADAAHQVTLDDVSVQEAGPVRTVVAWRGAAGPGGDATLELELRAHFFARSPAVRLDVTLRNPKPASHPGGFWELGEANSVLLRDVRLSLHSRSGSGGWQVSTGPGQMESCARVELFQASSGGPNWNIRTHVDRDGAVPLRFRGFRLRADGRERTGDRATPIVWDGGHAAATMAEFWQQCPKAIAAEPGVLHVGLFPAQQESPYELQPGEQKTHSVYLALGADTISTPPLEWARSPLFAHAAAGHYCGSGAFPYLQPLTAEPSREYAALVNAAIEGPDSFEAKREIIDEYGWRDFGDIYADHERVYYRGPAPVISHYNNQYDAIAGMARQFARSADRRWWRQMDQLARHVVDIDIYHTHGDKAAYNHGLFWHTGHYVDAGRSSHRSYPKAEGIAGGGPSQEHNYATGLVLHYFLTGEPASRDAARDLAQWVIDMDEGSRTMFRWLSASPTGLASSTYSARFHGPGRGAGHSIAALLDGHRVTGDRGFLDKAELLIRRCVHPDDDIPALGLLDIERRWSYTIFLHVLGRYLDGKAERGEIDSMYAYAATALGRYATWMGAHERPYLDRRDELEFPTETWAAQDLWKSEVFSYAARYGPRRERPRFLERASFFFDYAMRTLTAAPTRTLTRPVVLLLSRGLMHGFLARHPEALEAPLPPAVTFEPPRRPFVPQKDIAIRRAMLLAVTGAAAVIGVGLFWLLG